MRLEFTVHGEAQPAGSKRQVPVRRKDEVGNWVHTGRTLVIDANPKAKDWKGLVAKEAARVMNGRQLLAGALELTVTFYRPRPKGHYGARGNLLSSAPDYPTTKPDATKLLRGVEDALTGSVWRDDALVVDQHAFKRYGEPARVELVIEELPPLHERAMPAVGTVLT